MDAKTRMDLEVKERAYTTSKQVQAWFLGRSRDLWKKKYAELKVESKRLKQRVADVCKSRERARSEADAACRELQEVRTRNAELHAQLDALAEEAQKKFCRSTRPR
jgi:chromosome segregation ATPase